MQEIKFRVRDTETNKVYQPEEIARLHFSNGVCYGVLLWDGISIMKPELIPFTGKKDKNGNGIYTNDLLSIDDGARIGRVIWNEYLACFDTVPVKIIDKETPFRALDNVSWSYRCEITEDKEI